MNLKLAPVAVALSLGLALPAQAAITVFTSQASFLAAVSNPGVDDFDDLSIAETPGPLARTAGAYSYTATVGVVSTSFFPGSDDGVDFFLSSNNRFDTITLDGFSAAVSAVGGFFFGSDLFGFSTPATSITITATDSDGTVTEVVANPTTGSFLGFVSTGGLSSVTFFIGDEPGVWPSLDDLTLAATGGGVPEPATWAMMIAGFGMVGAALRRRTAVAA